MLIKIKQFNLFSFRVREDNGVEPLFQQESARELVKLAGTVRIKITGPNGTSLITVNHVTNYFGSLLDDEADFEWEFVPVAKCKPGEIMVALELD